VGVIEARGHLDLVEEHVLKDLLGRKMAPEPLDHNQPPTTGAGSGQQHLRHSPAAKASQKLKLVESRQVSRASEQRGAAQILIGRVSGRPARS